MITNPSSQARKKSGNPEPAVLGVDLGGSKILTAVINSRGNILSRDYRMTPANEGVEMVIREIINSAACSAEQAGVSVPQLEAIGLGVPGVSNPESGVVFTSPHLNGWYDVPVRDIVERESGRKTFLINDANAAALGELYFGAARGVRNFVYITVSTGIGGGIVINGELYSGAIGTAGEVGHMTIEANGPQCNCGNRGCWETLASGSALARVAKQQIKEKAMTSILDYAYGDIEKVTAQVIQTAAEHGDALANDLITQTGYYLGIGLANLINIFNPELIVIGGGLSNMSDLLFPPALQAVSQRAFGEAYRLARFSTAELGGDSGVLGAATFALHEIRKGHD
ncbi:ROK family protein [Chloroflexota bacterium]